MGQALSKGKSRENKGVVYLVGAGPGDPGLLTLRGAGLLEYADVVVYDRLVNPVLLDRAPHAKKIYVGKNIKMKKGRATGYIAQSQTNRLLAKLAREGKQVVRLKGGDPFIFGRGAEEASYLKKNGIRYEVVPGVSAGYAVPAYAGIPLTDRRLSSLVTFVTAHEQDEKKKIHWDHLAKLGGTLVFFMGVKNLPLMVRRLTQNGKSLRTPVSVIEWGTWPRQRVVEGTLANIVKRTQEAKIESPALTVVGEVNWLRKQLDWFEVSQKNFVTPSPYPSPRGRGQGEGGKSLSGKKVLVTRAKSQAGSLTEALQREGAAVIEYPAIDILPPRSWNGLDKALKEVAQFDWIVFTSANSVRSVFGRLKIQGQDARIFSGLKIAAIGDATRDALFQNGIHPDLIPRRFTTEALLKEFGRMKNMSGRRFLLPRTDIAPDTLQKGLERLGARVTQVVAYRTVPAHSRKGKEAIKKRLSNGEIDFTTFTSSSTVQNFFEGFSKSDRGLFQSKWISIGPVTSKTLRDYGQVPYKEASEHTVRGLVEVLASESK